MLAALAVFLAGTHWKAYHAGGATARADLVAYQLVATQQAAKASEEARAKEAMRQTNLVKVTANYAKVKRDNAVLAGSLADSLRQLETTLDSRASKNTTAPDRVDGTGGLERELLGNCATALAELAITADRLENKVVGLQNYARDVCK